MRQPERQNNNKKKKFVISAKTENQHSLIRGICENDIIFATGCAGTGKTFISCGFALYKIQSEDCPQDKLILSRPLVSVGKDIGSLPGTVEERSSPYFRPAYFNMAKVLNDDTATLDSLIKAGIVQFHLTELMRGMTFDNAFIVIDEAQNLTVDQAVSCITRIGENSKIIFAGDTTQTDVGPDNGLSYLVSKLGRDKDLCCHIDFGINDIQRNKLIGKILKKLNYKGPLE